jgi:DNA-binding MarR family transcriptional regulator
MRVAGFVERIRNPADGRQVLVGVTERGKCQMSSN